MVSQHPHGAQAGPPFESALSLLRKREGRSVLSTGSPELDHLTGGLTPGLFYLFYGDEGCELPDILLLRLLVEAVGDYGAGAVYLLCGNYRRSRTVMDPELLLSLIDASGLDTENALSKVHVVSAFSERHLLNAPTLVEGILERHEGFTLVAVQQLAKLFYGENALRHEELTRFTGVVSRLRNMCSERGVVLAATCRSSGRGKPVPLPEGGSFLRHSANTIVYLREPRRESTSAYALKHPDRARMGMRVHFGEEAAPWVG
ncbi:MAG: hypothetical protein PVJ38_00100 [Candidatus Bathyarchaeota archaeon]|jgi:hypothetical protein